MCGRFVQKTRVLVYGLGLGLLVGSAGSTRAAEVTEQRVKKCMADAIVRLNAPGTTAEAVVNRAFHFCRSDIRLLIRDEVRRQMASSAGVPADRITVDADTVTMLERKVNDKMRPEYVERLKHARRGLLPPKN